MVSSTSTNSRSYVDAYSPQEVTEIITAMGTFKAKQHIDVLLLKSILAGVFLSFSGLMTLFVGGGLPGLAENYPAARAMLQAFFYPIGLVFIVLTGAELVTSNMMVFTMTTLQRRTTLLDLARSWVVSWIGNLIGSFFVGFILVYWTGILGEDPYKSYTIEFTTTHLTNLNFRQIFLRAIAANWLVCLAVFMSTQAKDVLSKVVAIFLPVWLFVTVGYEHIVANMFLVQMGMYYGASLSVAEYIWKGMVPVTLGNILGGGLFVGGVFWYLYIFRHGEGVSLGGVVVDAYMQNAKEHDYEEKYKCSCHHHHFSPSTKTRGLDGSETTIYPSHRSGTISPTNMTVIQGFSRTPSSDRMAASGKENETFEKNKTPDQMV